MEQPLMESEGKGAASRVESVVGVANAPWSPRDRVKFVVGGEEFLTFCSTVAKYDTLLRKMVLQAYHRRDERAGPKREHRKVDRRRVNSHDDRHPAVARSHSNTPQGSRDRGRRKGRSHPRPISPPSHASKVTNSSATAVPTVSPSPPPKREARRQSLTAVSPTRSSSTQNDSGGVAAPDDAVFSFDDPSIKHVIFIDRDGTLFRHILNFLRSSAVHLQPDITLHRELLAEAEFYRLDELRDFLQVQIQALQTAVFDIADCASCPLSSGGIPPCMKLVSPRLSPIRTGTGSQVPVWRLATKDMALDADVPYVLPKHPAQRFPVDRPGVADSGLLELSRQMRAAVEIKDRKYMFRLYKQCFVGSKAVDWLQHSGHADSRDSALNLGRRLFKARLIEHVVHDQPFRDGYYFYRFADTAPAIEDAPSPTLPVDLSISEPNAHSPRPHPDPIVQRTDPDAIHAKGIHTVTNYSSIIADLDPDSIPPPPPHADPEPPMSLEDRMSAPVRVRLHQSSRVILLNPDRRKNIFSWEEIKQHVTPDSCWIVSGIRVYDVTNFLQIHPAGVDSILRWAGTDCTRHFKFHSESARKDFWTRYEIGRLHPDDRPPKACLIM